MTADPTPLGELVAIDFDATKTPGPCAHCSSGRFGWVDLPEGGTSLREWHLQNCPVVKDSTERPSEPNWV